MIPGIGSDVGRGRDREEPSVTVDPLVHAPSNAKKSLVAMSEVEVAVESCFMFHTIVAQLLKVKSSVNRAKMRSVFYILCATASLWSAACALTVGAGDGGDSAAALDVVRPDEHQSDSLTRDRAPTESESDTAVAGDPCVTTEHHAPLWPAIDQMLEDGLVVDERRCVAYATDGERGMLVRISLRERTFGQRDAELAVGAGARGVTLSRELDRVFVATDAPREIAVVDLERFQLLEPLRLEAEAWLSFVGAQTPLALAAQGRDRLLVSFGRRSDVDSGVVEVATGRTVLWSRAAPPFPIPDAFPQAIAASTNGATAVIYDSNSTSFTIARSDSTDPLRVSSAESGMWRRPPCVAPDGTFIVFASGHVVSPTGTLLRHVSSWGGPSGCVIAADQARAWGISGLGIGGRWALIEFNVTRQMVPTRQRMFSSAMSRASALRLINGEQVVVFTSLDDRLRSLHAVPVP